MDTPRKYFEVAAAVLVDKTGKIFIARRTSDKPDPIAGMWEFPGGKIEAGETPQQALSRELREELGCTTTPESFAAIGSVPWSSEKFDMVLHIYLCRDWQGDLTLDPVCHMDSQWIGMEQLPQYEMSFSCRPLLPAVKDMLAL